MKSSETLDLEKVLEEHENQKRRYGCHEVTIGFFNNGHGNEICDYISMDSSGIVRCYEIKVSIADLKSSAKMSWHGHYNLLVVSDALAEQVHEWDDFIPAYVGILVGTSLKPIRQSSLRKLTQVNEILIKESLIRSLWWRLTEIRSADDIKLYRKLISENRMMKKENRDLCSRIQCSEKLISRYERYQRVLTGDKDYDFAEVVERKAVLAAQEIEENRRACS